MLQLITHENRNTDYWFYCWLNNWTALDSERGAYLLRSEGRSRNVNQVYWVIFKGPQESFADLTHAPVIKRKRIVFHAFASPHSVLTEANRVVNHWWLLHQNKIGA